jgi:hypothetical protein
VTVTQYFSSSEISEIELLIIVAALNGSHHLKFDPFSSHSFTLADFQASLAKRHGTEKVHSFRGRNPKR